MRLIDADELKDFFFGETSGTEETIRDLMDKHNLTYLNDVNEDEVMDFARDLLKCVQNVINTEPTAFDKGNVIDDVFELLKSKRDARYMKIPFDDLEIRKYKNELKRGGVDDRTDD